MTSSSAKQKEQWTTSKLKEELHYNLITTIGDDGLRKYEEKARFLLYRIPIWRDQKTGEHKSTALIIELKDLSEKVKEEIANVSDINISRAIVTEAVSQLFENLGPKEKEYFTKNVRHLLKVRFI